MSKRRTIPEIIAAGISNVAELQEALYQAIQLEFSTIPLYLCAQWSINNDPSHVSDMIQGVVVQEMLHMAFACNMYTATGGSLKGMLATPSFLPTYPGPLPGGVHPELIVNPTPIGLAALAMFMSIEYPDVTPVVQPPSTPPTPPAPSQPTIGQFYQTVAQGFQTVFPNGILPNSPSQNQVVTSVDADQLFAINSVQDALNAIQEITDQGEGTTTSPDEGNFDPNQLAHYYTFAEVYYGAMVAQVGSGYQYSGTPVTMPTAFNFVPQPPNAPDQAQFIKDFTNLLNLLEACWTSGGNIGDAVGVMFTLQGDGTALIQQIPSGFTPQFTYL
jgi:hypothetical protein